MNVSLNSIPQHLPLQAISKQESAVDRLHTTPSQEILIPGQSRVSAFDRFQENQNTGSISSESNTEKNGDNASAAQERRKELDVQQIIQQLKSRDLEVKRHEQAHLAAGGQYVTSGANYVYQTGPDGNRYAIGGEVGIDTSPIAGNPEATLLKAQQIQAAALAPAQPSSQDHSVARAAMQMANSARMELAQSDQEDRRVKSDKTNQNEEATSSSQNKQGSESIQSNAKSQLNPSDSLEVSLVSPERLQFDLRVATN